MLVAMTTAIVVAECSRAPIRSLLKFRPRLLLWIWLAKGGMGWEDEKKEG